MNIRPTLLRPTDIDLSGLNKAREGEVHRPFLPAELEIERMLTTAGSSLSREEMRLWADHPNELVPVLFLERFLKGYWHQGGQRAVSDMDVVHGLARRALGVAEERGEDWTGFLALVSEHVNLNHEHDPSIKDLKERMRALRSWVEGVHDPEDLRPLYELPRTGLTRVLILDWAKVTLPEYLPGLLRDESDASRLIGNVEIMSEHGPLILRFILDPERMEEMSPVIQRAFRLSHLEEVAKQKWANEPGLGRDLLKGAAGRSLAEEGVAYVIGHLDGLGGEDLKDLAREIYSQDLYAELCMHPALRDQARELLLSGEISFSSEIVRHPGMDRELLGDAAIRSMSGEGSHTHTIEDILSHPNTTDEIAGRLAEWGVKRWGKKVAVSGESALVSDNALRFPSVARIIGDVLPLDFGVQAYRILASSDRGEAGDRFQAAIQVADSLFGQEPPGPEGGRGEWFLDATDEWLRWHGRVPLSQFAFSRILDTDDSEVRVRAVLLSSSLGREDMVLGMKGHERGVGT